MYSTAEKEAYACDVIYTATIISIFINFDFLYFFRDFRISS